MQSAQMQSAVVKLVLSGDTLILRGAQRGNQPPPERTLGLSFISAPHLGNSKRGQADDAFAFEAREFLRRRAAGKPVRFAVRHTTAGGREFGSAYIDGSSEDIAVALVREGWAQVTEQTRTRMRRGMAPEEEDAVAALVEEEGGARARKRGMWAAKADERPRLALFDGDAAAFAQAQRGKDLRATVEQVRDATTLRVTLHLPQAHQGAVLQLAGVRAPAAHADAPAPPFADEARFHVELRLLQQDVRVRLAAATAQGGFVGTVVHPAGNIAEWLVAAGYARTADWSAPHVEGGAGRLRELERTAQAKRLRIWRDHVAAAPAAPRSARAFDATVLRVVSGDTLLVRSAASGAELEVQLASVRQPRAADAAQGGYAERAREQLRRWCIGRAVSVAVDYTRPPQEGFRARDCATVRLAGGGGDLGERLVRQGLATVLRHRNDDLQRSSGYDELLAAAAHALDAKAGLHSGKPLPPAKLTDASESAARARSFVSNWQRSGRIPCVVDHVAAGARLRLVVPKENTRLSLVLAGVRCPRAPRGSEEAGEPGGADALALA
ncbi:hypothetical protein GGF37_005776, partial [Kickxella alabastrina]